MAEAKAADGTKLYYERTGAGAPVLLVMGLGMNATGWWRTIPVLAEGLEVIAFDNRGAGRSDVPDGPYTADLMADDAMAVLDAAGIEKAHVYGISLGGMIAQDIVVRHPDRVDRLVLGATTPGGPEHVAADAEVLKLISARGMFTAEQAAWVSVPINYARRTREQAGQRIAEDIQRRLRYPITGKGYGGQLEVAMSWALGTGAAAIAAPHPGRARRRGRARAARERPPAGRPHPRRDAAPVARRRPLLPDRRARRRPGDPGVPHRLTERLLTYGSSFLARTQPVGQCSARPTPRTQPGAARRPSGAAQRAVQPWSSVTGAPLNALPAGPSRKATTSATSDGSMSSLTACGARMTSSSTRSSLMPWALA